MYDLSILDFENIRKALKHHACTPYGEESITHLTPAPNIRVARIMQQSVSAARQSVDKGISLNLGEVPNVRIALRQAASSVSVINTKALFNIFQVLKAGNCLLSLLASSQIHLYPKTMPNLIVSESLLQTIDKTVTDKGRLRIDASPKLKALNNEMVELRKQVEKEIKTFCREKNLFAYIVNKNKIIWQGERAVVAVKSAHIDKVRGIIKGSQAAGTEQLVEPLIAMGCNNAIERLSQKISSEQQVILKAVAAELRVCVSDIEHLIDGIAWVDIAFSAGLLSAQMNAHAPTLVDEAYIKLDQAYHPTLLIQFLQGKLSAPVPLSVTIERDKPYILITGPNTGGKTVVLKTVGLLQLMAQCGLHIPAEADCVMGWFDTIMVDMGDKQSMYHQLSTFAGHVEVMKDILASANQNALFLLDELGTGTDPEEGAALAMAMIDELIKKDSMGIVNTHLSPLKSYAENHPKIVNAAMQFDEASLSPTYQLKTGMNGESFGLIIAERNGLPSKITQKASEYLAIIKN